MTHYLSDKLRVISLLCIILIILLHSYNFDLFGSIAVRDTFFSSVVLIQNFFYQGVTRIAVPLLFCISGYLFFLKMDGTNTAFLEKFRKRLKSVFIPYLAWSMCGLLLYAVLQALPQYKPFFKNQLIINYTTMDFLRALFINPIPYQLWFLQDLLLLIIASPVIYIVIRNTGLLTIIGLLIVWAILYPFKIWLIRSESVFFFCSGAYLAIFKSNLLVIPRRQHFYRVFILLWSVILSATIVLISLKPNTDILLLMLYKLNILTGMVAVWISYDQLLKTKDCPPRYILTLSSFSFFLYAIHEPFLSIVKKSLFHITGVTAHSALLNFFLAPLLTLVFGIVSGYSLKKVTPGIYYFLTGGR